MPIRYSIIDYLNSLPLNMAFKDGIFDKGIELIFDLPSQCADNLATGKADVGLISSIEYQNIPGIVVAPDICIASRSKVRSVLILAKKPLDQCRTIAVDRFSRSSVALLRVILMRRYGQRPDLVSMTPDAPSMLEDADAALIIGDAALGLEPSPAYCIHDLAELWYEDTGLPFVFAFWAIRTTSPVNQIVATLNRAKAYGLAHLQQRFDQIEHRWPLNREEIHDYFTENIHYDLGAQERLSLETFYAFAKETGVITRARPVNWANGR